MKFAHPEILWALGALAVPVIVHLFNFRRFKRIPFSNVRFLQEVQLETKSRNKLRHLLVLLSRMLALTFVILAFAQPFIPLEDSERSSAVRSVSLYIDNSFSMEAAGEDGRLIDLAKARAAEVIAAFQTTDRFNVITNDLEGRHQRFYTQEEALNLVGEIEVSPSVIALSEVLERQQDLLLIEGEGAPSIFVFSDLQKNTHDGEGFLPDSAISVRFVPEQAAREANLFIDSVWFDTPVRLPGQAEVLRLRINNTASGSRDNVPMRLDINGRQVAIGSFNVIPGTYTDTALYFTDDVPGIKHCRVGIQDHPIVYDDEWFLSYQVAERVNVLLIRSEGSGRAFRTIFANDPFYRFSETTVRNVNYGELNATDLVILDGVADIPSGLVRELSEFMAAGGTVLFIPASEGSLESWNELLLAGGAPTIAERNQVETRVADLNLNHLLYRGVFDRIPENLDLPAVKSYYRFNRSSRSGEEVLMALRSGEPFFFVSGGGESRLFVSAVGLEASSSNFAQHALFVPTMLRVAELSRSTSATSATLSGNNVLRVGGLTSAGDQSFTMHHIGDETTWIPRHRSVRGGTEVFLSRDRLQSGNYALSYGDSVVAVVGLNYPREESVLAAYSSNEWESLLSTVGWPRFSVIDSQLETLSKTIEELDEGKRLWDMFLLLAALMLIAEVLLIKFLRT